MDVWEQLALFFIFYQRDRNVSLALDIFFFFFNGDIVVGRLAEFVDHTFFGE